MRVLLISLLAATMLVFTACESAKETGDYPAQAYMNAVSAMGSAHGGLHGRIVFPSEYTQHSTRFTLNGLTFVTHPDGRFRIERVPEGTHMIEVRLKGYEWVRHEFTLVGDEEKTLEPMRLVVAKGAVLGRLVDEKGGSARDVEVHLAPFGGVTRTDGDGIFNFVGVSAGDLTLTIKDPEFFLGNQHFELTRNERRNLGNIAIFRQFKPGNRRVTVTP